MVERVRGPKRQFTLTEMQKKLVETLAQIPEEEWTGRNLNRAIMSVGYNKGSIGPLKANENIFEAARYIQKGIDFEVVDWKWGGGDAYRNANPDEDREEGDELWNPRMEMFCQEIVADLEANARKAAVRAGYSNPAYGGRLMAKKKIRDRIAELRAERKERLKVDADNVLQNLMTLSNTNITDFATWYANGMVDFDDSANISRQKLLAVKKIKQTIKGVGRNQTESFELELESKSSYVPLLMKHLGLLDNNASTDPQEFATQLRQLSGELSGAVPGGEI